jgi:TatD DNase family protein
VRAAAQAAGVTHLVIPAVQRSHWQEVIALAHLHGDSYALGIHPLYTPGARSPISRAARTAEPAARGPASGGGGRNRARLFVPGLDEQRQIWFYEQQIRLACEFELPVILHVRKSSDRLLKTCVSTGWWVALPMPSTAAPSRRRPSSIWASSWALAEPSPMSARLLRELAASLPLQALVLETDAPDIPPHWLYTTAEQRAAGQPQGRNSPPSCRALPRRSRGCAA